MLRRQERHNEGTLTALMSTESLVQQDGCDNHTHEGKPARAYNITQCRRHCLLARGFLSNLEKKMDGKNYEDDQNCPVCQSSQIWLSEEFFESNYFRIDQHIVLLHILIFVLADCRIINGQDKRKKCLLCFGFDPNQSQRTKPISRYAYVPDCI